MILLFTNVMPNLTAAFIGAAAMLVLVILIVLITRPETTPLQSGLLFQVEFNNLKFSISTMELKNTQFVTGTLKAVDAKGDEAQIQEGSVTVSSSNEEVVTVEKDPDDEKKIKVTAQRAGAAIVTVSADADLGEGVTTISAEVAINVTPSEAVGFGIQFDEPQEQ